MNLKKETLKILERYGKTPKEVSYVTDGQKYISFDEFLAAADFNYDNGYGGNEISLSLKVVGHDFWLERSEYDGSEWWSFKSTPQRPKDYGKLAIRQDDYDNLYTYHMDVKK